MDLAGVGQAGFFFYRERVKFGAQHDRGSGAIFEDGDDAGAAYVFSHVVAERAQLRGQLGGSLSFVRREFGVLMDIEIESVSVGINEVDFFGVSGGLCGGGGKKKCKDCLLYTS